MQRKIRIGFELLIIPLGIGLIQWEGVFFWKEILGSLVLAIIWSLTLEILAIWQWLLGKRKILAIVLTLLLISGPLLSIGLPLLKEFMIGIDGSSKASERVEFYRNLAEKRIGWQEDLRKAEEELRKKIVSLPWIELLKTFMVMLSLILFTLGIVISLNDLGKELRPKVEEGAVARLRRTLSIALEEKTLNQISEEIDIKKSVLREMLVGKGFTERAFKLVEERIRRRGG